MIIEVHIMVQISKLINSRNKWRSKASSRADENRELRKTVERHKQKIEQLESELRKEQFKREIAEINNEPVKKTPYKSTGKLLPASVCNVTNRQAVRSFCICLYLQSVVSFRSINRIIKVNNDHLQMVMPWRPHFTSVINWICRLGLGLLHKVNKLDKPWFAIIDHSIGIGSKKVMVVLRVEADVLVVNKGAIRLADCECIGLDIAEKVNGETIEKALQDIFEVAGKPVGFIKDRDAALHKGASLVATKQEPIMQLDDIGHVVASALQAEFEKDESLKALSSLACTGARYLRHTCLASFTPPQTRTKGRFQRISHLACWALKIIELLNTKSAFKNEAEYDTLYESFSPLLKLESFIIKFSKTCEMTNHMMQVLKTKGLTSSTNKICRRYLKKMQKAPKTKRILQQWLSKHMRAKRNLPNIATPISSDAIESLFGQYKLLLERTVLPEVNARVLTLPTICGRRTGEEINQILESVSHQDLLNWEKTHIGCTLKRKKQSILAGIKNPKNGKDSFCFN